jgi:hypothetical protein
MDISRGFLVLASMLAQICKKRLEPDDRGKDE